MKIVKSLLSLTLLAICSVRASAIGGVVISTTASHSGPISAIQIKAGESISYSITGTWVGVARLERSLDGTNYAPVGVSTGISGGAGNSGGTVSGIIYDDAMAFYRWNASEYTSGSFVYILSDRNDAGQEFKNKKNLAVLSLTDDYVAVNVSAGQSAKIGGVIGYDDYTIAGTTTTPASVMPTGFSTFTVAANTLLNQGDCVVAACWGTTSANTNTKSMQITWGAGYTISGSTTIAETTTAVSAAAWRLDGRVCRTSTSSKQLTNGTGTISANGGAVIGTRTTSRIAVTRDLTASNLLVCACTNTSAVAGDCSFEGFSVRYEPAP